MKRRNWQQPRTWWHKWRIQTAGVGQALFDPISWPLCRFNALFMDQDKAGDVTRLQHSAHEVVRDEPWSFSRHVSEQKWSMTEVGGAWRSESEKREKFVLGPLQGRGVTNWGEGDEWGHSLGLMKEFLLSTEWGWAHLHLIGGHKPVTSKIAQEALWDSRPSNKLGCTRLPGASIGAWQLLQRSRVFLRVERTLFLFMEPFSALGRCSSE